MEISDLESYKEGWRQRRIAEELAERERLHQWQDAARQIAERLRTKWGAKEVYLFGSVARGAHGSGRVYKDSDLDIAVSGTDSTMYFEILSDLEKLSPTQVDLILIEDASPGLVDSIRRDGIPL